MTSWGKDETKSPGGELAAMRNMLTQYPSGLVACVSDSYDIWKAINDKWGKSLKNLVMERNGLLVIRPDSGPPARRFRIT